MRIPWEIAKMCLRSARAMRQFRAYTAIARASHGQWIEIEKIYELYKEEHGISRTVTKLDLDVLCQPFGIDGTATLLVEVVGTKLRVRSTFKVLKELGMEEIGWVEMEPSCLRSIAKFRDAARSRVLFTNGRDANGGCKQSREMMTKMGGGCENTQRNCERRQGVLKQPNFADVAGISEEEAIILYGTQKRPEFGPTARQISNTYYLATPAVTELANFYTVKGRPADEYEMLFPEYGDVAIRQTFHYVPDVETVEAINAAGLDVFIGQGFVTSEATGERWGRFIQISATATPEARVAALNSCLAS